MAARKTTARRTVSAPEPPPCPVCKGSGEVPVTIRVGRKRRHVGEQSGFCLTCFGTGQASDSPES